MKKIYLCIMTFSVMSMSFGQALFQKEFSNPNVGFQTTELKAKPRLATNNQKIQGEVIWSNGFEDDTTWVIDNDGQTGDLFGVDIDTITRSWFFIQTKLEDGRFASFANGPSPNPTPSPATLVEYTITTADSIVFDTVGGSKQITLEFDQYGARFNDLQAVQISTNGTTFTTVNDSNMSIVALTANGGDVYDNPDRVRIPLEPFLNANDTALWIRFSWTTRFPNEGTNANVWITYGWFVDNVRIVEVSDNDLTFAPDGEVTPMYAFGGSNIPYTRIPSSQVQPLRAFGVALNQGTATQLNVEMSVDINNGATVETSDPITSIAPLATDTFGFQTGFTPSTAVGTTYDVTLTLSSDSTEDVPEDNDILLHPFEVTEYIYAMDDFGLDEEGNDAILGSRSGVTNASTQEFEIANVFEIINTVSATAIDAVIGVDAVAGSQGYAILYQFLNGQLIELDRTGFFTITEDNPGELRTFLFDNPVQLAAGFYAAAIHGFDEDTKIASSGESPFPANAGGFTGSVSILSHPELANPNPGENFFILETPMIRLNLDPMAVGIDELLNDNVSFSVSPNPSNGIFNISLDTETAENVTLSVRNIVGQTVVTKNVTASGQTRETISLENYDKGVYFLTIDNSSEQKTVKLIVE